MGAERTRIPVGLRKFVDDETTRLVLSTLAAFLISQVLAGLIHGFILATDYGPYCGTLLRSMDSDTWQVLLLPVSHLSFICGLMWVYTHVEIEGSTARKGVLLGCLAWIMGQVPLWLIWYAEQPWPGSLVVTQLGLELLSSIVSGLTIAITARPSGVFRMSPAEDSATARLLRGNAELAVILRLVVCGRSGITLGIFPVTSSQGLTTGEREMNSLATGITAALVSGVVMYTVGANAPVNAFNQNPAFVQTLDGQFVPASTTTALRPAAAPSSPAVTRVSNSRRASPPAPRRTAASPAPAPSRQAYDEDVRDDRSWSKTAMVIGGSAAGGAGVGGIVGGKKGALIGAAIGGGAASIFEATQRR